VNNFHPAYFLTRFYTDKPLREIPTDGVILSACATTGEVWSDQRNQQADADLARMLQGISRGSLIRLIGYSPTDDHAEPSWMIDLDCLSACRLGVDFKQDALYVIERDSLFVVRCSEPSCRAYVAPYKDRLDSLDANSMRKRLEGYGPVCLGF
jgi:hypothetical protein